MFSSNYTPAVCFCPFSTQPGQNKAPIVSQIWKYSEQRSAQRSCLSCSAPVCSTSRSRLEWCLSSPGSPCTTFYALGTPRSQVFNPQCVLRRRNHLPGHKVQQVMETQGSSSRILLEFGTEITFEQWIRSRRKQLNWGRTSMCFIWWRWTERAEWRWWHQSSFHKLS